MTQSTKRALACMHHAEEQLCLAGTSAGWLLVAGRPHVCLRAQACGLLLPRVHHQWRPDFLMLLV